MSGGVVWVIAAVLYGCFLAWYVNWRGRLRPAEVERLLGRLLEVSPDAGARNDLETLRRFLLDDDGREFFMLNLVRLADGNVADPVSGVLRPARDVMQGYTGMFLPALLRRAGHPAIVARKIGGYVDAWGVAPDPGWSIVGYMRYRSRRDLAELVVDPRFAGAHDFKFAAMPQTFSFPTRPFMQALVSPAVTVGLVIALVAALVNLVLIG